LGCKKEFSEQTKNSLTTTSIESTTEVDPWVAYRKYSPYSTKVVNALRTRLATAADETIQTHLFAELKPQNYYLYYKVSIQSEANAVALNNWLEADTSNIVLRYPLDSVAMFPHLYTQDRLEALEENNIEFYTTVPIATPLPSNMNAILLDTLYVPDETENVLDFTLNLVTANVSQDYVNFLAEEAPEIYDNVLEFINGNYFIDNLLTDDGLGSNTDNFNDQIRKVTGPVESYDRTFGPGIRNAEVHRNVSFDDNTLGRREGVNNLQVIVTRFHFIGRSVTSTNIDGNFSRRMDRYGAVAVNLVFGRDKVRVRSFDVGSNTVASAIFNILKSALQVSVPATHLSIVNGTHNVNNYSINFSHGSKKALWSITYNGIQEANQNTVNLGMRNSVGNSPFLDVLCYYHNKSNGLGVASAPMLGMGHVSSFGNGVKLILKVTDLIAFVGSSLPGILPDVIISQTRTNPINSHDLRQTIYHEYGHTLHYFKANTTNNNHWVDNINHSLGDGYGTAINETRGAFFSLSEGWADYIGHTYAFTKYGTNLNTVTEINAWTGLPITDNYQGILERVPTFFNNFIPRGLFYDLTDANTTQENWFDRINGHSSNQIYQLLSPAVITIQQFRAVWENTYPDINNADLFNRYNIN